MYNLVFSQQFLLNRSCFISKFYTAKTAKNENMKTYKSVQNYSKILISQKIMACNFQSKDPRSSKMPRLDLNQHQFRCKQYIVHSQFTCTQIEKTFKCRVGTSTESEDLDDYYFDGEYLFVLVSVINKRRNKQKQYWKLNRMVCTLCQPQRLHDLRNKQMSKRLPCALFPTNIEI